MPKSNSIQANFSGGEISPQARGRFDISKYANSAKVMENFIINQLGSAMYRPATRYVAPTKNNGIARLMPFQYNSDQDYVMEMGDLYTRFYNNDASSVTITSWDKYIKFLSHFDGADASTNIIDEIGNAVVVKGDAQLDTAQKKFGTASLLLDGTGDYIELTDDADWNFGDGDFTIDLQVRTSTLASNQTMVSHSTNGNNSMQLGFNTASGFFIFQLVIGGATVVNLACTTSTVINTWHHVAIERSGNNWTLYLDGADEDTAVLAVTYPDFTTDPAFGAFTAGGITQLLTGHLDEARVSKGVARYGATSFTAPTTPYAKDTSSEMVTTYLEADLFAIMQAHKNDVKYLTHGTYPPRKISRTDATTFAIADVAFVRGPFMDDNITAITINPSVATGSGITLTASSSLFDDPDHVGSLWKVKDGVVKITAVASATSATADVQAEPDGTAGDLNGTSATTDWAEGAFSVFRGYPKAVAFHDGRLYYGGTTAEPQKFWGSVSFAYDNFDVGTAADSDAVTFEIAAEERNAIQWLISGKKSLSIGTTGGTFSAGGSDNVSITPSDIQITRDTNYGATLLPPKRISSFFYYVQRTLNTLREISFNFDIDAKIASDMNLVADHILREGSGVVQLDHQQSPNDRIWCVRNDGELAVLTRNAEQEVMGWARMTAGVDSTGAGKFESVAVIPKQSTEDQTWVVTNRTIGGVTKRFIEFFMPENFDEDWDAVKVDSSVSLDSPVTIIGMTNASPGVFSATAHGLTTGDQVKVNGVVLGNVSGAESTTTDGTYLLVEGADADKFTLTTLLGAAINTTTALGYGTYVSGGEVRLMTTAISGLGHLEGEEVYVQADGVALTATFTVAGGAITLATKAAVVHAGFKYNGTIQLLKLSDGSAVGTGQTKNRRIYLATIRVDRSLSMKIGLSEAELDAVQFGATNDATVTALVTGDLEKLPIMRWDKESEMIIRQDSPNPLNVLCIIMKSEVID